MVSIDLYNQAFNLYYHNWLAAQAQGSTLYADCARRAMNALIVYMADRGYFLDGSAQAGFFFWPVALVHQRVNQ